MENTNLRNVSSSIEILMEICYNLYNRKIY